MITKDLRQKLLSLAICGKLVPQDPNDEPAAELLKRINPNIKPITEDTPFDIPESWCWCRLGDMGKWQAGSTPSRSNKEYYGGDIPWLKTGDLNDCYIEDIPEKITQKALDETSVKLNPAGSVLIAMYGATIGKLGILKYPATTNQACCACVDYKCVTTLYLFYFLLSNRIKFIEKGYGGAQPNISKEKIVATFIPLPPLSEQERIVARLEELLACIDTMERAQEDLNNIKKWLRSKLLSLAICGKLVPQDLSDEPAITLLKRINPDFTPPQYEETLPQGWCACQLKDIVNVVMGQSPKGEAVNKIEGLEFHQGKICFTDKYLKHSDIYTREVLKVAEANSLLLSVRAPVGDVNITDRRICIGRGLCALQPKKGNLLYFFYLLSTLKLKFDSKATGTTFNAISKEIITSEVLPLPPLSEQERIVARLEELFGVLDRL